MKNFVSRSFLFTVGRFYFPLSKVVETRLVDHRQWRPWRGPIPAAQSRWSSNVFGDEETNIRLISLTDTTPPSPHTHTHTHTHTLRSVFYSHGGGSYQLMLVNLCFSLTGFFLFRSFSLSVFSFLCLSRLSQTAGPCSLIYCWCLYHSFCIAPVPPLITSASCRDSSTWACLA